MDTEQASDEGSIETISKRKTCDIKIALLDDTDTYVGEQS